MATVRSVRRDELDDLLALYRMLQPSDPDLERDAALEAHWDAMLADDSLDVIVAATDEHLVASCVLSLTKNLTRGARPFAVVENVVTHENYRNQGFGEQVVREALDRADRRGCYKAMLLTGTGADWKLDFYEQCGFDREEKTGFVRYFEDVDT